jgi:signal transduction histidine kinase
VFIFRSVRYWLTLLFLVLTAAGSAVAWLYVVPPLRDRLVTQKTNDLLGSAQLVASNLVAKYVSISDGAVVVVPRFEQQTQAVDQRLNARVVIVDVASGKIISDTRPGREFKLTDYPKYNRAIAAGTALGGTAEFDGSEYSEAVQPFLVRVNQDTNAMGAVLVSASLRDVDSAVSLVTRQILLSTLLAMAVTLVAGYMAAYLIGRRLKSIERGAEAVAAGDFEVPVPVRGRDEIGQLALTFNTMGSRLESAFSEVEDEKRNAETLLDTLSEGVIAVTADGRVARANPAAVAFFGPRCTPGAGIDEAFPEDVALLWREAREGYGDGATAEDEEEELGMPSELGVPGPAGDEDRLVVFEMGQATLEALTYPVEDGRGFDSIVVVRDVTQQARVERARRDFVANASHEFKTPLFSLSGFLELLDEENLDTGEREEFLGLMKEQVERLQGLSLSLLDLSQVDAGAVRVRLGPVDLPVVAMSVLDEFQARAAEKQLTLTMERATRRVRAIGDEERVAQVLRALVDNATKFSQVGGRIWIALETPAVDPGMIHVVVGDDGPGIEQEELEHVFDRFYRGRSTRGSKSGTGLGLSIARDLATLMGGTLTADSIPGHGARFTLALRAVGLSAAATAAPERAEDGRPAPATATQTGETPAPAAHGDGSNGGPVPSALPGHRRRLRRAK